MVRSFVLFFLIIFLTGCSPSPDRATLSTEIAGEIYGTQTASAPQATATYLPPTPVLLPTPTQPFVPPQASVSAPGLNLRSGPGTDFPSQDLLSRNTLFKVIGQFSACDWYKVQLNDGKTGWVKGGAEFITLDFDCNAIPHGSYRPPLGTLLIDRRNTWGLGALNIENPSTLDAVVFITDMRNQPFLAVYLYPGTNFKLTAIPSNKYPLYFLAGKDWDGDERTFMVTAMRKRLIETADFSQGKEITINLQKAGEEPGITFEVNPDIFPSLK